MSEEQDKPGFRVTDRRRFTDEGETRTSDETPEAARPSTGGSVGDAPVSFSTFVLGISTQALAHLGEIESPLSGKIERDLGAAKHVIDILGMLRDKTRNNLEQAEERMLDSILYDLRMRYVDLVRASKKEEA